VRRSASRFACYSGRTRRPEARGRPERPQANAGRTKTHPSPGPAQPRPECESAPGTRQLGSMRASEHDQEHDAAVADTVTLTTPTDSARQRVPCSASEPRPPAPAASHYRRRHKQPTPAHGIIIIDNTIRSRTPDRDPPRTGRLGPAGRRRPRARPARADRGVSECAARCVMNDVNLD
jgi:hypothetical protein